MSIRPCWFSYASSWCCRGRSHRFLPTSLTLRPTPSLLSRYQYRVKSDSTSTNSSLPPYSSNPSSTISGSTTTQPIPNGSSPEDLLKRLPPSLATLTKPYIPQITSAYKNTISSYVSTLSTIRSHISDVNLSSNQKISHLSGIFNDLTGYTGVSMLKQKVIDQDAELTNLRKQLDEYKKVYDERISQRSALQKEMNHLLQRKSNWNENDVQRFTELYRNEHRLESEELTAKQQTKAATDRVEEAQVELMNLIRERYIEEQLWSDKIRRASTWYTWILMLVHFLLFLAIQTIFEPRRRERFKEEIQSSMVLLLEGKEVVSRNERDIRSGEMSSLESSSVDNTDALALPSPSLNAIPSDISDNSGSGGISSYFPDLDVDATGTLVSQGAPMDGSNLQHPQHQQVTPVDSSENARPSKTDVILIGLQGAFVGMMTTIAILMFTK